MNFINIYGIILHRNFGGNFPHLTLIIESVDFIIESVDSISRDEQDVPLTQYITNA